MQWEKSQTAGKERKGTRWRTKPTVCARARAARGEEGGGWTNGAWSARDDTRTLLLRSVGFGRNSRALGAHVWPAADLSPSCRRFEFLPERKPRLSCTTNGLPYPQRRERRRTVNWGCGPRWGREDARGWWWVHLVARHDYATAIDLLVPIVETSCSPRCRIKSWMSPTGTIWSRGMADFTISCLV